MEWYKSESTELPDVRDITSSKIYNYVRRNIAEEERENMDGGVTTIYTYEEMKIPKESWGMYLDLVQTQADIEYLNMLTEDM